MNGIKESIRTKDSREVGKKERGILTSLVIFYSLFFVNKD